MTQAELQMRLAKSVQRAVRQYLKDGGKVPQSRTGDVLSFVDDDGESWNLMVSYGNVDAPGSIFLQVL